MTPALLELPLVVLSVETKQIISTLLNPPKVIPAENGLPRDWRGLAHLSNMGGEMMPLLASHPDPSGYILTNIMGTKKNKNITIKDLQAILKELDRWDILDDTAELFERDAEKYLEQVERSETSADVIINEVDEKVLTVDDLHRLKQGLENQYYDAFLLYDDEDLTFATEMMDKLENQYGLKLCVKDRDLIGGISFEHEAVMTLISERCNRLIVIVSSSFLKSPANKFFLNYAQALGIEKQQRKVVPCLYEKCKLPPQLNYMFILDYNRAGIYDFWGKLRDSVKVPNETKENVTKDLLSKEVNCHNQSETNRKINEETSKHVKQVQEQENHTRNTNELKTENSFYNLDENVYMPKNNKKSNGFLQRTIQKWTRKAEHQTKDYVPITGTVSLPSLQNLDALNTSVDSINKKEKTKFINKYMKKVLVKS